MNNVVVFKATHHIDGGIGFSDMRQKFIAQTFARARTRNQARDIDKFDDGRKCALWHHNLCELLQTGVRHFHDTHIGFDRAKRIVFSRNTGFGQGVEQGGFANVGQAHDAAFQTHGNSSGTPPAQRGEVVKRKGHHCNEHRF